MDPITTQAVPNQTLLQKYRPLIYQFLRFAVVGAINTGIDFGILNILSRITGITEGSGIIPIKGGAFLVANVNSYLLNKRWTFKDNTQGDSGRKFSVYLSVSIVGAILNISTVYLITNYVDPMFGLSAALWLNAANLVATGVSLVWNFIGYKLIVFRGK
jgi:putative flippase GtrA